MRNGPIESIELRCPVVIEKRGLFERSAGAGKFRGGFGVETKARGLVDGMWNLKQSRRRFNPPWGLNGGKPGQPSQILIKLPNETEWKILDASRYNLPRNATVILRNSGGGGWGSPLEREPELVLNDFVDGLISIDQATNEYGVFIDPKTHSIDFEATKKIRSENREKEKN